MGGVLCIPRGAAEEERCEVCADPTFVGLGIPSERSCAYAGILERMDELRLPYADTVSLLTGFRRRGTWDIYLVFSTWPGPVTAACVARLMEQFRESLREWTSNLRGYNGFPRRSVRVRIFGFVFCRGVRTDATFDARYGAYPIVRGWSDGTSEESPWIVTPTNDMYARELDLHEIRVVGNRTRPGVTFVPERWDDGAYRHPEGCVGYQTRFWHGVGRWNATAQRHYLRVDGVLTDPERGEFGAHLKVLTHEMGHCFFLDDLYDTRKYPVPPRREECSCEYACRGVRADDTIMHGAPAITPFDHAQIRHVWNATRESALAHSRRV